MRIAIYISWPSQTYTPTALTPVHTDTQTVVLDTEDKTQGPHGKTSNLPKTQEQNAVLSTAAVADGDANNTEQSFKQRGVGLK